MDGGTWQVIVHRVSELDTTKQLRFLSFPSLRLAISGQICKKMTFTFTAPSPLCPTKEAGIQIPTRQLILRQHLLSAIFCQLAFQIIKLVFLASISLSGSKQIELGLCNNIMK